MDYITDTAVFEFSTGTTLHGGFGSGNSALHRDEAVGVHGHGIDATCDQELSELGMVARRLAAQPDLGAGLMGLRREGDRS